MMEANLGSDTVEVTQDWIESDQQIAKMTWISYLFAIMLASRTYGFVDIAKTSRESGV